MNAVIYARYSSSSQREETIEVQIRECTKFAEQNGYTVLRCYTDKAISGTTDKRPDFQQMIKDSKNHLFDTVLVLRIDRFARDVADSAAYRQILKENGVRVISTTENFGEDAVGQLMSRIMESMAEYYSNELREKVQRGQDINAEKCMWNGGTLPIGYVVDQEQHLQIDPLTAPYVLEAFKQYDDGHTITEIRDYLNGKGVTNTKGKPVTWGAVQHMLSNRRYIGEYAFREIVVPDGIPAIVPLDLFERVQEKLAKNKKAPARAKAEEAYLLTTKIFCGHCGTSMNGESGKSRNGTIHRYYKCHAVKKKQNDCKKKPVKKEWIEDLVVNATMEMLMDDDMIEAIVSLLMWLQDEESSDLPLYEKQLRETETAIDNIISAVMGGMASKALQAKLTQLEEAKEELLVRIEEEKLVKPKIPADFMRFWLHKLRKLDMTKEAHRQMLIDTFVNAVHVYDDKLLLTFNFKDDTRTITFNDVKAATSKSGSDLDCSLAPYRVFITDLTVTDTRFFLFRLAGLRRRNPMLVIVWDNLDILHLHLYNNTIPKKRGVRMLSKPQHGWTDFSLGENCYSISYLSNVPLDWLDRAIFGLETLLPFEIYGCCEPGRMVCTVDFFECRIFFENDKHQKDDASLEIVPVSMLDFCQKLHKDISDHIDAWQKWSASYHVTKEDIQSRLDRLQKLIRIKENCFG